MEFSQEDLNKLLKLREFLIKEHTKKRDYKNNQNAIMKEVDHVLIVEKSIKGLDDFLAKYVKFN